jgi:hypothetical protein
MNRIATLLVLTAVSAAALPVPLAGAVKTSSNGFVPKVNDICGDAVTAIDDLSAGQDEKSSAKSIRSAEKIAGRMMHRLDKVKAPPYAAKRYRTMIRLVYTNRSLMNSVLAQAKSGHEKAVADAIYKIVKNDQKFEDLAVDLNLGNCVQITFPGYSDSAG